MAASDASTPQQHTHEGFALPYSPEPKGGDWWWVLHNRLLTVVNHLPTDRPVRKRKTLGCGSASGTNKLHELCAYTARALHCT